MKSINKVHEYFEVTALLRELIRDYNISIELSAVDEEYINYINGIREYINKLRQDNEMEVFKKI